MPLTRSFRELVQRLAAADPDFEAALRRERSDAPIAAGEEGSQGTPMTPARKALLAFAKAWTYPILGNEDVPVTNRLFEQAYALAKDAAVSSADPPEFEEWLKTLHEEREGFGCVGGYAARGDGLFRSVDRQVTATASMEFKAEDRRAQKSHRRPSGIHRRQGCTRRCRRQAEIVRAGSSPARAGA